MSNLAHNCLNAPHVWSAIAIVSLFASLASQAQSRELETMYSKARNPEFWDWMSTQYQMESKHGHIALSDVVSTGKRLGMLWINRYDGSYKEQYTVTDMRMATTEKKTYVGSCKKAEDRKKMF